MPEKIESMTEERRAEMKPWAEKWIKIGLSTDEADFDAAEEAVRGIYELIELPVPRILRAQSPLAATIAGTAVASGLSPDLDSNVPVDIINPDYFDIPKGVDWNALLRSGARNDLGGQFWCGWVAYATFFRDVLDWESDTLPRLALYETLARTCGWVWWHEDACVIGNRPSFIRRDNDGRLHCEDGPSIQYRDGWAAHHWHGTGVPAEWIAGNLPPTDELMNWPNTEQRRAGCEIMRWDNVLKSLNAVVIDQHTNPQVGTLLEVDLPDSGKERFLQVKCGTGRTFAIPVPPDTESALVARLSFMATTSPSLFYPQ